MLLLDVNLLPVLATSIRIEQTENPGWIYTFIGGGGKLTHSGAKTGGLAKVVKFIVLLSNYQAGLIRGRAIGEPEDHGPYLFQKTMFLYTGCIPQIGVAPHFGVPPTFEFNARPLLIDID